MAIEWSKEINRGDNSNDELYFTAGITLKDLVIKLEELCKNGHRDKKVSICGCSDFYIHLFDKDSKCIAFGTDLEI